MVDPKLLLISVITLFCYLFVGFILRKKNLVDSSFSKLLSVYVLYVAQVALLLHGFFVDFDAKILKGTSFVFGVAVVVHFVSYFIVLNLFKKAPDKIRAVLRYAIIFSNAGYMGIPVISDILGEEYVIYATFYIFVFNIFNFSIGRLIYTNDKKYIKAKEIIINPAVVPLTIGFIIFITGAGGWVLDCVDVGNTNLVTTSVNIFYNVLTTLKNTVAPASMIVIGCRLAEIEFKGIFKDKYLYPYLLTRHFVVPFISWCFMKILIVCGILTTDIAIIVTSVVLVLNSTPSAASSTMFAELYNGDARYAGKLVAISTLLSVATMPVVALLLKI